MSTRAAAAWYGLPMAALTMASYALPSWRLGLRSAIGVAAAATVLLAVRRHRPRPALPWLLLAAALLCLDGYATAVGVLQPRPAGIAGASAPAAAVYLLGFVPLAGAGLWLLARTGGGRDRASLLDALTLSAGVGLLAWIFVITGYLRDPGLSLPVRTLGIAQPLCDVLLLAMVAWLFAAVRRAPAVALLGLGVGALLGADLAGSLAHPPGAGLAGLAAGALPIACYACWGAAALHPSMVRLTGRRPPRPAETRWRPALVALSSLIAPAVLFVEGVRGPVRDAVVIAICSAVTFLLVLTRLSDETWMRRAALARERGLRQAGAALVSATEVGQVSVAVRAAVAQLLPADTPYRVVLAPAGTGQEAPTVGVPARHALVGLVYARGLEPAIAAELGAFEVVARCPLLPGGTLDGGVGVLLVGAREAVLGALQGPLQVLASQAALALQRIGLASEINRRRGEEYFRTLVHNSSDVVLILDADRIRYASPSASTVFGMDDLAGRALEEILHAEDRPRAGHLLDLVRAGLGGAVEGGDWRVARADGCTVTVEASCRDLRADATVAGLVLTLRDVTERRRLEEELTRRALHDSLTGLANRLLLRERAEHALARMPRTGRAAGLLFIDVDDFNLVNDTMGHQAGDDLLVAIAQRLREVVRPNDTVARMGGDEFAILVDDARDASEVEAVAGRVVSVLTAPFSIHGALVSGTASVGLATGTEAGDVTDLMRQADLALYVAKGAGKSQWRRYQSSLHAALIERMDTRAALERAVADGAFVLHYQPIVELATGLTVGFEALVRWEDPQRGLVAPGGFIDIAEESGLIIPIGDWVLEQSLATALHWAGVADGQKPYISVNVSARQFRAAGFTGKVLARLHEAGLPADALMLEITESLLLREDEQVWRDLAVLREAGIRIAIDDFGTGYSSLSYLRQLPIDVLKLDRSFVGTITSAGQQRALVDGIVGLAHILGLATVAEGIEQEEQRVALRDMGCQYGQGYLFAKPLTYPDALRWLLTVRVAA